ncbi:MAG: hypothetical protein M3261_01715 [Thermoproteota archaeon]|nr:hypothetical protein [Thermoproteota archaeon]
MPAGAACQAVRNQGYASCADICDAVAAWPTSGENVKSEDIVACCIEIKGKPTSKLPPYISALVDEITPGDAPRTATAPADAAKCYQMWADHLSSKGIGVD